MICLGDDEHFGTPALHFLLSASQQIDQNFAGFSLDLWEVGKIADLYRSFKLNTSSTWQFEESFQLHLGVKNVRQPSKIYRFPAHICFWVWCLLLQVIKIKVGISETQWFWWSLRCCEPPFTLYEPPHSPLLDENLKRTQNWYLAWKNAHVMVFAWTLFYWKSYSQNI